MTTVLEQAPRHDASTRHSLEDRFVVVTGGSSGIGRELAAQLADRGASVLVGSRRRADSRFEHRPLDLASQSSVATFARDLNRHGRPIDMLVLNAGVHVPWKKLTTEDGHELHWQVNYLSNFLLFHLLQPSCAQSELKRVLYVASEAHRLASVPAAPLLRFSYHYARSKEAAISFFLHLQQLHPELVVRVVSPGYVTSEIHRNKGGIEARIERVWSRPRDPHEAAREILDSFEPRATGAVYWDRGKPATPSLRCLDSAWAEVLWRATLEPLQHLLPDARAPECVRNFARNVRAFSHPIVRPSTLEALCTAVRKATEHGRGVKVVGQRHSYNDCFHSHGSMVSLEHFQRVVGFDPEGQTITCEAGISIGALCEYLDQRGFTLRYGGSHGIQTLAGALATGTHGYGRDGGVMSELVRAVTLLRPDGTLIHTSDERDLRALRLSVGALGVIVDVTLAIEHTGSCLYEVACMRREPFNERLGDLARANEYLRFVRHPFDARHVLYVTINRQPGASLIRTTRYLLDGSAIAPELLVPLLKMPPIRKVLGRVLAVRRMRFALQMPFSSLLFIRSGPRLIHPGLAMSGMMALARTDWLNMELAIPLARFSDFDRLFAQEMPALSRLSRRRPYFSSRVVGAARNVLLAPNYDRDVVFCDIHADPTDPSSQAFLRRVERAAIGEMAARPHWGKMFFSEHDTLRRLYPATNFAEFADAKQRFDPESVFSNAYTRRVLGL